MCTFESDVDEDGHRVLEKVKDCEDETCMWSDSYIDDDSSDDDDDESSDSGDTSPRHVVEKDFSFT